MGVLALVALLGLPLVLGGHHHAGLDQARDCSTCVVAHCGPIESTAPLILPAVLASATLVLLAAPATFAVVDLPAHPGRAPPSPLGDSAA
jgi:hypothetical protein